MSATQTRNAQVGDVLVFGQSPHGLPILRREEDSNDCPTCVKMGRKLTISNISSVLQSKLGIGETAEVIFVEDVDDAPDSVMLENGKVADLYYFVMDKDFDKLSVLVCETLSETRLLAFVDKLSGRTPLTSATSPQSERQTT